MTRQVLGIAFKYGLGLGLLAYVVWKYWALPPEKGPGLADALQNPIQPFAVVLAFLVCLASVFLTFVRWFVLVRAQGLPFTLPNAVRLGLVGFFLSTFLPGSVGGDIIKAYCIARDQRRRTVAVATVLIDRAVGLWGLVWLVALVGAAFWLGGNAAILGDPYLQWIVRMALACVAGTVGVWLGLGFLPQWRADRFAWRLERYIPKVGHALAEFWRAVWMYRCQRRSVALALLLALVGHVGFVLTFYFSAQVFQPSGDAQIPSLVEHYLVVPIGMTWQALFPSPGGVGGGEAGYAWLYGQIGRPPALGALGCLAQRMTFWSLGLVGYFIYLRTRASLPKRDKDELEPALPVAPEVPFAAAPAVVHAGKA